MEDIPSRAGALRLAAARTALEPALGAHLETSRVGYEHHGVYVGNGKVVHYAGFCRRWRPDPVEEVTLFGFSLGHTIRILEHPSCTYSPQEIVDRARSRLGERRYRLLTNNCEHFSNWCVRGLSQSHQAQRPVALLLRLLREAAARLLGINVGAGILVGPVVPAKARKGDSPQARGRCRTKCSNA